MNNVSHCNYEGPWTDSRFPVSQLSRSGLPQKLLQKYGVLSTAMVDTERGLVQVSDLTLDDLVITREKEYTPIFHLLHYKKISARRGIQVTFMSKASRPPPIAHSPAFSSFSILVLERALTVMFNNTLCSLPFLLRYLRSGDKILLPKSGNTWAFLYLSHILFDASI